MSHILTFIRAVLGFFILLGHRLTAPKSPERLPEAQEKLNEATSGLTLYHLEACPFCVKVRRQILRQGLVIRMKEIKKDPQAARELIEGGKLDQAPCLRIDSAAGTQWMYESSVINSYLVNNYLD